VTGILVVNLCNYDDNVRHDLPFALQSPPYRTTRWISAKSRIITLAARRSTHFGTFSTDASMSSGGEACWGKAAATSDHECRAGRQEHTHTQHAHAGIDLPTHTECSQSL